MYGNREIRIFIPLDAADLDMHFRMNFTPDVMLQIEPQVKSEARSRMPQIELLRYKGSGLRVTGDQPIGGREYLEAIIRRHEEVIRGICKGTVYDQPPLIDIAELEFGEAARRLRKENLDDTQIQAIIDSTLRQARPGSVSPSEKVRMKSVISDFLGLDNSKD